MAVKKTIEIDVRTEDSIRDVNNLTNSIEKTDRQVEATKETTDSLVDALDNMTGGAITAFRGIVSGAKSGVIAMKSLKVAIAATGIGLLVVAVGTLITYFTQTERGAETLEKAFAAIGATIDVIKDRISQFGEGLALIFSGKFREGAKLLASSMVGVITEIKNETKAAYNLTKALQEVEDKEIALIVTQAKRRASIEALRLAAEDEKLTNEQRADALRKAADIQNKITDDEIAIAKERARIAREQLALGESRDEDVRASNELTARVIELEAERDRSLKRLQTRLNAFTKTQEDLTKSTGDSAKKTQEAIEAERKRLEAIEKFGIEYTKRQEDLDAKTLEEKLALDRERAQAELDNFLGTETEKREAQIALDEYFYSRELEIQAQRDAEKVEAKKITDDKIERLRLEDLRREQAAADAKVDIQNYVIDVASQGIGLLKQVAGENKTLQKALLIAESAAGIAKIIINTNAANAAAIAKYALIPGGQALSAAEITLNKISAGIGIASTIAATAKGLQALGGGGSPSSGGGSIRSNSASPAAPPQPSFNIVGNSQANQLGTAINRDNSPVRAYVVSTEMTSQQQLDRNIRTTATVG